jgi:hypothetical protein
LQLAVIVAVFVVRMVKVSAHQIVNMVAMRDGFVAAPGFVDVASLMRATLVCRRAAGRILRCYGDRVVVDVALVHMMHVPIVQVISMTIMFNSRVSAIFAVDVSMPFVFNTSSGHLSLQ